MGSREANIERLNYAIMTLNEDAEGVHGIIAKSADDLENATAAGNRAAENAEKIIEALEPLTELLATQHKDSAAMLEEAKKASDDQRATTSEQIDNLKATVDESLGKLSEAQSEAFDDMQAKVLKEHERTRDELQTDMLGFKNVTSARLDALETGMAKADASINELEGKVDEASKSLEGKVNEAANSLVKKLTVLAYAAIAIGLINLVCLVILLLR